jgi:hypothetical protein
VLAIMFASIANMMTAIMVNSSFFILFFIFFSAQIDFDFGLFLS